IKAFVCPLPSCRRPFEQLETFLRHLQNHEVTRPYQCGQCLERFTSPDVLAHHAHNHQ
ncbi:hypothetical protein FOMPIDRAFT_1081892, partial [Fomitopsis schrenkii]